MDFVRLIFRNVISRPLRAILTAFAVAIGAMAVVALGILTSSLKASATAVLKLGAADVTVAQKGSNLFDSSIPADQLSRIEQLPGVAQSTGVLLYLDKLDNGHPQQIHIGIRAEDLNPFGVQIQGGGAPFTDTAHDEVIVGQQLANALHKKPGDQINLFPDTSSPKTYRISGVFALPGADSLVRSYAENAIMLPLPELQAVTQRGDAVTLAFLKVAPHASEAAVQKALEQRLPGLAGVISSSDYGRVDRNLQFVEAANTGGRILAAVIAISGVLNAALLSFFERIREFGVLRSIGWARGRLLVLVMGEALVLSVGGALVGILLGWGAVNILQHLQSLRGLFIPIYRAGQFRDAIVFAAVVAFIGAVYPALRAAFLSPLEALRRE
jgi:putative ABC transport system permease protein